MSHSFRALIFLSILIFYSAIGFGAAHKIQNVVILGNSIVAHPAAPTLGWYSDWGMAASARDSDFVHRIIAKIHQVDNLVDIRFQNISVFENTYDTYDLSQLAAYRNADMIIVKISENVKQETSVSKNFALYYDNLINYLAPTDSTVKIIVDGFWPSTVNNIIKDYAAAHQYPFVTLPDLFSSDSTNSAKGLFENVGVANHPSDKGMRNIASRILSRISTYFPTNNWYLPSGWDGVTTTAWKVVPGVNDGTSADKPFLIETPEHLAKLAESVNAGNSYAGSFFKLTANLDLGNKNWTCIGGVNPFSGNFDGDGHSIANLSITKWTPNIGLFGLITSATIQNLGIESGSIVFGGSNAGAIVGQATGTATKLSVITNCYNKASLVKGATDPRLYIGGIAGLLYNNSRIDHCFNRGNISNDGNINSNHTGGIAGAVATNSTVFSCYSTGTVMANNIKGGVVGSNWSATTNVYYNADLNFSANAATQAIGNKTSTVKVGAWYFGGWSFPADANGYTFHISPTLVSTYANREPVWGWREDAPGVMVDQINYAANSGISFWGFCWYENTLVDNPKTMDNLNNALGLFMKAPNRNRLGFCLLSCFPVSPVNWDTVCSRTAAYFKEPNYLKVNGKPVMIFFNTDSLISGLGGIDKTIAALNKYRQKARDIGVGEILIGARTRPRANNATFQTKYAQCGFDFLTTYQNADDGKVTTGENDYANLIAGDLKSWNAISSKTTLPFIATIGTGYDMRPWAVDHPTLPASDYWYTGVTPDRIGAHLQDGISWTTTNSSKVLGNLLLMYAWNENAEGGWLTPTNSEGNARLDAVEKTIYGGNTVSKGLSTADMKSASFVSKLNTGGGTWTIVSGDYPDLSKGITTISTIENRDYPHVFDSGSGSITISGATIGKGFLVIDLLGRIINRGVVKNSIERINPIHRGIYIVKADHKVVKVYIK
ncbi:MAG: glycoside hydrolase family 99-like domain-containing protein [Bacteroidales bacterium]|nr:glycoside hydrolase family 99-like domain-containing protein [Bacteroidales bacterium]